MENKKIETLITAYATALDHQDAAAAETFLDPEFRIVLNNHNNSGTTSILSRAQYLDMIRRTWGERLRQVFAEIPNPQWTTPEAQAGDAALPLSRRHQPVRIAAGPEPQGQPPAVHQVLAQGAGRRQVQ